MKNIIIRLFNLEPDDIAEFEVSTIGGVHMAFIRIKRMLQVCSKCGMTTTYVHDNRTKTISHAALSENSICLKYMYRRFRCPFCGCVFPEKNPFTAPSSRLSKYSIIRGMTMLRNPKITFSQVANEIGVSTNTVIRMFDKYAAVTSKPLPQYLCIDEIYVSKYRQKVYACVLVDMLTNQLYDLRPTRFKRDLSEYFSNISLEERERVKYICIDMWNTYRDIAHLHFPNAKLCVDSFHVIQLVNRTFTGIRVKVMKQFDDKSEEYRLLKRYHYLLNMDSSKLNKNLIIDLRRHFNTLGTRYISVRDLVNAMLSLSIELEVAYDIKERYSYINRTKDAESISHVLDDFIGELYLYGMNELDRLAGTLSNWRDEIINSFDMYAGRRISNGPIESVNSRLKNMKNNANGYKNFDRFRLRALYSLNDDSSIKNIR